MNHSLILLMGVYSLIQQAATTTKDNTALFLLVPSLIAFLGVGLGVVATMRSGNQKAQTDFTAQLQLQVNNQAVQILALEARVTTAEGNERECQKNLAEAQRQLAKVEYELREIRKTHGET